MELMLVPPSKFVIGTPAPLPLDDASFQKEIVISQWLFVSSFAVVLVMLSVVALRAVRKWRRPQLSLLRLLLLTITAGACVLSAARWQYSVKNFKVASTEYSLANLRYNSASRSETPAHSVLISSPFYLGKFPVTQQQYHAVTGNNPSYFISKNNPVESISWEDAHAFCIKLKDRTNRAIRLPSEAEWEFACRAGTETAYYSGDHLSDLDRVAWYNGNSQSMTHPVGEKECNAFGLYDMHGNVWQWCQDWYSETYYSQPESIDPQGPLEGRFRIARGGSWRFGPNDCRSSYRGFGDPLTRDLGHVGFRIALTASQILAH
jgi:formylglycine-generating enzyme required for sulfatase activity